MLSEEHMGEGVGHLSWNVVHRAEIVDGDVHGIHNSFDESGTESVFRCCVEGNVLSAITE